MELVDFLRARLDEDETAARAAADELGGLTLGGEWRYDGRCVEAVRERDMVAVGSQDFMEPGVGEHIARHDPARVLAEVEAKREMLRIHRRYADEPEQACLGCAGGISWEACPVIPLLAGPYRDHPDFDPAWLKD